jgi:hypothetical protein
MIRLRETLDHACRHRWLGPLVIVLLVVLIAFVAIHEGGEKVSEAAGELCVALAGVVLVTLVRALPPLRVGAVMIFQRRGPPLVSARGRAGDLKLSNALAPLRL